MTTTKFPSDRSIRSALTTLKKANCLRLEDHPIDLNVEQVCTVIYIPTKFLSPKKTRKVRLKTKKIESGNKPPHYISPAVDGY